MSNMKFEKCDFREATHIMIDISPNSMTFEVNIGDGSLPNLDIQVLCTEILDGEDGV